MANLTGSEQFDSARVFTKDHAAVWHESDCRFGIRQLLYGWLKKEVHTLCFLSQRYGLNEELEKTGLFVIYLILQNPY